jgi:hypothetical protein
MDDIIDNIYIIEISMIYSTLSILYGILYHIYKNIYYDSIESV